MELKLLENHNNERCGRRTLCAQISTELLALLSWATWGETSLTTILMLLRMRRGRGWGGQGRCTASSSDKDTVENLKARIQVNSKNVETPKADTVANKLMLLLMWRSSPPQCLPRILACSEGWILIRKSASHISENIEGSSSLSWQKVSKWEL